MVTEHGIWNPHCVVYYASKCDLKKGVFCNTGFGKTYMCCLSCFVACDMKKAMFCFASFMVIRDLGSQHYELLCFVACDLKKLCFVSRPLW